MIEAKRYLTSVLETDLVDDILLSLDTIGPPALDGGDVVFTASLARKKPFPGLLYFDQDQPGGEMYIRLRFYGGEVLRLLISRTPQAFLEAGPMLEWHPSLEPQPARLESQAEAWQATSPAGAFFRAEAGSLGPQLSPDGHILLNFQGADQFFPHLRDALPILRLERPHALALSGIAFRVLPGEHFAGTGERFERPDLFGQQIDLVNFDAAGVNNPRAYKNAPFLLSSRGYGLFVHSSAKMRLDLAAHSTRSITWLVEDDSIDLFVIGGGAPDRVLYNYRCITGFPALPPVWSFGAWMSRSTYTSQEQILEVANRLRSERYPVDVLHLDTGWFEEDWVCDWTFSAGRFPDPPGMLRELAERGFHVSLWQIPYVHRKSSLAEMARENRYVARETDPTSGFWLGYTLDFTNPEAVAWYSQLVRSLLEIGVAAIKADFGEEVDEKALYQGMDGNKYHNLFALLYQRILWDATVRVRGEKEAVIWARSGWAGSQRYPVHWGGDAASTYDGLAGSICGGLHLGQSGFAFWSHDVGGINGIPDYGKTPPSDDLYVRWTQAGVFSSHLRFHGATPREPWEFPAIAGIIRHWLRFRYALLPYILGEAEKCVQGGLPMLRALALEWPEDPAAWAIGDEYMFGEAFLVCPVLSAAGVRDVYLPAGRWLDFWSGQVFSGPRLLSKVACPLARLPLFVRFGQAVQFAEPVQHTGLLPQARRFTITFDDTYPGYAQSHLAEMFEL